MSSWFFAVALSLSADLWAQTPVHPGSPDLSPRQRAEFALSQEHYDEALRGFQLLLDANEKDGYAIRGLVRSYLAAKRLEEGEAYLEDRLHRYPNSATALYGLGFWRYSRGQNAEARNLLEQAVASDPGNALALNNLAAVLAEEKTFAKALECVRKAIEIDPAEILFYRNLQHVHARMGQLDRFQEEYVEYRDKGPAAIAAGYGKVLAESFRQQAFARYSQGELGDAIAASLKMVEIYREIDYKEGLVAGLFALGLLYEEKNERELALKYYREILDINPRHIQSREKIDSLTKKN